MHALPPALAALAAYPQFIVYIVVPHPDKPGKTNKFPCDFRTGRLTPKAAAGQPGGAHDPQYWTDAGTAIAWANHWNTQPGGKANFGVGFVFTHNDPFWFLDIDGAFDGAAWSPLSQQLCAAFPGAAIEVSNSRKGLHLFGTASHVAAHKVKNTPLGLEFYTAGRFVALTGLNAAGDASRDFTPVVAWLVENYFKPDTLENGGAVGSWAEQWAAALAEGVADDWRGPGDDDLLIARMLRSNSASAAFDDNKASFADLWNKNVEKLVRAYPPDTPAPGAFGESEADSALAQHLAFWTGRDAARTLRLMQRAGLKREKYDREDYLPRTILATRGRQRDVLTDKEPEPSRVPHLAPVAGERREQPRPELVTGGTFLSIEQQRELFIGCVYVCDAHRVLVPGGLMLQEKQFRVMFGGYSFPMDNANERTSRDAWEAFTQNQAYRPPLADTSCFKPDRAPGEIINEGGRTLANTWWPVDVPRKVGDASPFWIHLAKLLPNERDRMILLCYMAACVQHKGYKFQWAPLLQGVEGNGKSFLSRCVAYAVGRRYVHWPKASKLAKEFNSWMVGKVFYAVEDIYTPGARMDVVEELKPMITGGDGLEIEGKGVDQVSADICGNFMFNTNHKDAIVKTRNDRRFGVFYTAQQQVADLTRDGMTGNYMSDLYNWFKADGAAIVAEMLHTFVIPDEYNPARLLQRAPDTTSTEEAITASLGGIEQEIMEAIAQGVPGFVGDWVSSMALASLLERIGRGRNLSQNKRRDLLAGLGYIPHPGLLDGRVNNTILPDAGKPRLYIKVGSPASYLQGAAVIANAYSTAQNGIPAPAPMYQAAA